MRDMSTVSTLSPYFSMSPILKGSVIYIVRKLGYNVRHSILKMKTGLILKKLRPFRRENLAIIISTTAVLIAWFSYRHSARLPNLYVSGHAWPSTVTSYHMNSDSKLKTSDSLSVGYQIVLVVENRGSGPASDVHIKIAPVYDPDPDIRLTPCRYFKAEKIGDGISLNLPVIGAGDRIVAYIKDQSRKSDDDAGLIQGRRMAFGYFSSADCREGSTTPQVFLPIIRSEGSVITDVLEPLWKREILFAAEDEGTPWRSDPRLQSRFTAKGHPDDLQVVFKYPSGNFPQKDEVMWVRVIAYDQPSDTFLGWLLNEPKYIKSVRQYDNVVFKAGGNALGMPSALGKETGYGLEGWPSFPYGSYMTSLVEGIRAYRSGNYRRCLDLLSELPREMSPPIRRRDLFVVHFILGRCYAELYETLKAIQHFKAAIALEPMDLDANMALLAELSVMAHKPAKNLTSGSEASWEKAFTEQLQYVRSTFSSAEVTTVLNLIFDETTRDLSQFTDEELRKLRKIGFATLRWKRR